MPVTVETMSAATDRVWRERLKKEAIASGSPPPSITTFQHSINSGKAKSRASLTQSRSAPKLTSSNSSAQVGPLLSSPQEWATKTWPRLTDDPSREELFGSPKPPAHPTRPRVTFMVQKGE